MRAVARPDGEYLYDLDDIEKNHEAYAQQHTVVAASAVTRLVKAPARDVVADRRDKQRIAAAGRGTWRDAHHRSVIPERREAASLQNPYSRTVSYGFRAPSLSLGPRNDMPKA